MNNKGLLFIPDISGFTKFINETEIGHCRLIIQELLELLINANELGLEVSEIEGDAILFYKFGEPPSLDELYKQVEKMFCVFHRNLINYEQRRYCQCEACASAINLSLKVITHYGEFTNYTVKNFRKLIGKDVIVAHQLLKNDIKTHEYWMVTDNLSQGREPVNFAEWMQWHSDIKQTEAGEVPYHYTMLGSLKLELSPDEQPQTLPDRKFKLLSLSQEYETDIITLFHASGDFQYRDRWREGVKKVEVVNHFLPRVGMQCRCILENGTVTTYSNSYSYESDRIEFSETDEKGHILHYILEENGNKTQLTLDLYADQNFFMRLWFGLTQKNKIEQSLRKSLKNLAVLIPEIRLPRANN